MIKAKTVWCVIFSVVLLASANAWAQESRFSTHSASILSGTVTTSQQAVFGAFLSDIPAAGVDTAISLTNVVAPPFVGVVGSGIPGGGDTTGTLEFYLYNQDGSMTFWETSMDPMVGIGLNPDGTLGPGQTYAVLLRDLLTAAGVGTDQAFSGYAWVVANFDGVVGTYNVTIFSIGFTQNFEFLPGLGQSGVPNAGIPVSQGGN